jgi:hypothetical protein
MAKVTLVNPRGFKPPTDHLEIYLTARATPDSAALAELKRQLERWPVDDLQLRRVPLRLANPISPEIFNRAFLTIGHEIYIHFSTVIRNTAAVLTIGNIVKNWWNKNTSDRKRPASQPVKAKRRRTPITATSKKARVNLSTEQWETIGQFNDYAFEYGDLSFDETVKKVFGKSPFSSTPTGRRFRRAIFDRERQP